MLTRILLILLANNKGFRRKNREGNQIKIRFDEGITDNCEKTTGI